MKKIILCSLLGISQTMLAQDFNQNDSIISSDKVFEVIKIFPNPTSEILFIKNGDLIDSYEMFNLQGEPVQKGHNDTQIISLIELPIGQYFLLIEIDGFYKNFRVSKF